MDSQFPFIFCILDEHPDAAPEFLGTGVLMSPAQVLTCKHVVLEREPMGRLTETPRMQLRVQNPDGSMYRARAQVVDPKLDLALLELEVAQTTKPPPFLWGITEALEVQLRAVPLRVAGYAEVEPNTLWQHPLKDLTLLPAYREGSEILTQVQLAGGIPSGCSGSPVILPWGERWLCAGIVYLGGERSATSRVIMADPVVEFLYEAGLHTSCMRQVFIPLPGSMRGGRWRSRLQIRRWPRR